MFIKLLIISVIWVAFVMLALGVKLLFDPDAEFTLHGSCGSDETDGSKDNGCSHCQIKDIANCEEDKGSTIKH